MQFGNGCRVVGRGRRGRQGRRTQGQEQKQVYCRQAGRGYWMAPTQWWWQATQRSRGGPKRGSLGNWREEWQPRGLMHTISEGCQAWKEAALVYTGEMEVPRLRIGCREKQVQKADEVKVVATHKKGKKGEKGGKERRQVRVPQISQTRINIARGRKRSSR